ncbi:hypothetical protein ACFFMR_01425 [Micromonospora andamanensis]|nr:hypothetical protein [Micromonospora andamanensis]
MLEQELRPCCQAPDLRLENNALVLLVAARWLVMISPPVKSVE